MNSLYSSFALLLFIGLSGLVPEAQAVGAKAILGIAKDGIQTLEKGFELYNKFLDKIVPWSELNKTIARLDQYRSDYSAEAAELIGDVKTKMMDGMDAYYRATQSVYEWCDLAIKLLTTYSKLFNGKMNQSKFKAARITLLKVLDAGIRKMTVAQDELGESSASFNVAAGKLSQLNHRLTYDFSEHSAYYQEQIARIRLTAYGSAAPFMLLGLAIAAGVVEGKIVPELNAKMASIEDWYNEVTAEVENAYENIDLTKAILKGEIMKIGEVKSQTEVTQTMVELDDTVDLEQDILHSVAELIAKCKEYQLSHINAK